MGGLNQTLNSLNLTWKMAADNLKKLSGVPPSWKLGEEVPRPSTKAPGSKALASWLTVRIAEISNLANPRPNLANAGSPWALCGSYLWEKSFEPVPGSDFSCEPGCGKCGQFDCDCLEEEDYD